MPTEIAWTERVKYQDIARFAGYRIGSDGSVWSRLTHNGRNPRRLGNEWKRMKPQSDGDGYLALNLFRDGTVHRRKVHLLVLEAFVGPRPSGYQGCHENGIKSDCSIVNLRWDTASANQRDRLKHGTSPRGAGNGKAKLMPVQVIEIRKAWS